MFLSCTYSLLDASWPGGGKSHDTIIRRKPIRKSHACSHPLIFFFCTNYSLTPVDIQKCSQVLNKAKGLPRLAEYTTDTAVDPAVTTLARLLQVMLNIIRKS